MFAAGKAGGYSPTPTDPYFNYVTALLHGDGTNGGQNNTFLDSSTNNFSITRSGNTTQGTFTPYGANWSNYFDGSGDYLNAPASTVFQLNGDFTLEAWIFLTSSASAHMILGAEVGASSDYLAIGATQSRVGMCIGGNTYPEWSYSFSLGVWYHVAVTRSGSTLRAFVNGSALTLAQGSATNSAQMFQSGSTISIGRYGNTSSPLYFNGYISNARIVKGTAVYTAAFTPPTQPLTAITNTSLLTCQSNRFIDNSSNNFTITRNGDVSVQRFSPFAPSAAYSTATNGGSGYFDGSGDSLSTPVTAANNPQSGDDYTVEAYIYLTNQGGVTTIYSGSSVGYFAWRSATQRFEFVSSSLELRLSYTYPLNRWCHVAVSRQSGTVRMFVDGILQSPTVAAGSATGNTDTLVGASTTYYFGSYTDATSGPFYGYIAGFRLIKGSAVYTATFTPPTAPPTAVTNTAILLNFTNAGIFDNAMMNDLETVGNAQISTSVKKYGTGSISMLSSGDYCKAQPSVDQDIGGGDFTIEFWINFTSLAADRALVSKYGNSTETAGGLGYVLQWVQASSVLRLVLGAGGTTDNLYTWSWAPSTGVWYHVAVTRSGTSARAFINGTQIGSTLTVSVVNAPSPNALQLGKTHTVAQYLLGYMDDFRFTKGYARYTANFTAPTQAFPNQ